MKILHNGVYREMTEEESKIFQGAITSLPILPPSLEERTRAIEAALLSLLGGDLDV